MNRKEYIIGIVTGGVVGIVLMSVLSVVQPQTTSGSTIISTLTDTPTPTTQMAPSIAPYPSEIIDLTNWKITLPIGSTKKLSHPLEIRQPELATYKLNPWFIVNPDGQGIRFRAAVNAPTTGGTKYPRSELREMSNGGETNASWSSTKGTHTIFLDQAVTAVPKVKRHVVAGQIHDDNDDIIVIRLEFPNLYVNVDGKNVHKLDSQYTLGKRFNIKFVVESGETKVYYNGSNEPAYTLSLNYSEAYFKTGVYTQSNCSKEGSSSNCNSNNYGEVVLYQAYVTHE